MGEIVSLTLGEALMARRAVWFESKSVDKVDVASSALVVMDFLIVSLFFIRWKEMEERCDGKLLGDLSFTV